MTQSSETKHLNENTTKHLKERARSLFESTKEALRLNQAQVFAVHYARMFALEHKALVINGNLSFTLNSQMAGCDNILYSNTKLDRCGVCGGDNSTCVEVSGNYLRSGNTPGYKNITVIPEGASELIVRQQSAQRGSDSNFLGSLVFKYKTLIA